MKTSWRVVYRSWKTVYSCTIRTWPSLSNSTPPEAQTSSRTQKDNSCKFRLSMASFYSLWFLALQNFPLIFVDYRLACKNRAQNDLLCVQWDVKPYARTHSLIDFRGSYICVYSPQGWTDEHEEKRGTVYKQTDRQTYRQTDKQWAILYTWPVMFHWYFRLCPNLVNILTSFCPVPFRF